MNRSLAWAVLAAYLSLCAFGSQAIAQGQLPQGQPPAVQPAAGPRIALIDVNRIFKNHVRFEGMMNDMKAAVQEAETWVQGERKEINQRVERLQGYNKGTVEYKSLEEEIARRQADLEIKVRRQRSEFLQREAKIYYTVYQEIWQATDYFARQYKIDIVLRFNGEEVNPNLPDSVLTGINKPVVWYDRGLDITDAILAELNRTAANPGSADRRGAAAPRPTVPFNGPRQ